MALVSVIIPVYNVDKYLEKCMNSVIAQTYTDLEIILVDDGSPDHSGSLCDELARKDHRIRVIHKVNGGLADARNTGCMVATGEYVAYIDSDDWVEPDYIECLLQCCMKNHAQMSVCRLEDRFDEDDYVHKEEQYTSVWTGKEAVTHRVLDDGKYCVHTSACNKLYQRELIKNISFPKGRYYEDIVYSTKAMLQSDLVVYTNRVLYHYRCVRAGSIMNEGFNKRIITDELPLMSERNLLIREAGLTDIADLVDRNYCIRAIEIYRELHYDKSIDNKGELKKSCLDAFYTVYQRCSKKYFSALDKCKVLLLKYDFGCSPLILSIIGRLR